MIHNFQSTESWEDKASNLRDSMKAQVNKHADEKHHICFKFHPFNSIQEYAIMQRILGCYLQ